MHRLRLWLLPLLLRLLLLLQGEGLHICLT
jgi:hypothetical protein